MRQHCNQFRNCTTRLQKCQRKRHTWDHHTKPKPLKRQQCKSRQEILEEILETKSKWCSMQHPRKAYYIKGNKIITIIGMFVIQWFACVYVWVCVCVSMCMCECVYVWVCVYVEFVYVWVCVYVYVWVYVCVSVCIRVLASHWKANVFCVFCLIFLIHIVGVEKASKFTIQFKASKTYQQAEYTMQNKNVFKHTKPNFALELNHKKNKYNIKKCIEFTLPSKYLKNNYKVIFSYPISICTL